MKQFGKFLSLGDPVILLMGFWKIDFYTNLTYRPLSNEKEHSSFFRGRPRREPRLITHSVPVLQRKIDELHLDRDRWDPLCERLEISFLGHQIQNLPSNGPWSLGEDANNLRFRKKLKAKKNLKPNWSLGTPKNISISEKPHISGNPKSKSEEMIDQTRYSRFLPFMRSFFVKFDEILRSIIDPVKQRRR